MTEGGAPVDSSTLLLVINDLRSFFWHRIALARGARAAGWDVHVAAPPSPRHPEVADLGFTSHVIGLPRGLAGPGAELAGLSHLFRLYRRLRPDAVHHHTLKPSLLGSMLARATGVPAIVNTVTGLGYLHERRHGLKRAFLREASTVALRRVMSHRRIVMIFQNPDDRGMFLDLGIGTPERSVLIRGSGVDSDWFTPAPEGEPPGAPRVVLPARMVGAKGVREFVRAAARLKARGATARFVLVGAPDPANPTSIPEDEIEGWQTEGVVEYWGHRDDMREVFRETSIVVLPSYREGLPKVLLEAAASGLPLITTDVPGCREVVRHGINGLLVPALDDAELAAAMHTLLENPDKRAEMGRRGRRIVRDEFEDRIVVQETLSVYERARRDLRSRGPA